MNSTLNKKSSSFDILKYLSLKNIKDIFILSLGTFIVAIGIYFFKFPNHFSTGGVAGLAIVIPRIIHLSPGYVTFFLNAFFMLLGFLILGKSFGIKTAYSSTLLSIIILLLEKNLPLKETLTNEPILELFFAILLPAIGSAILFNYGASTGGTDVIAMIIKKYTGMEIGNSLFVSDVIITLLIFLAFDVKTGLYSVVGLMSKSLVLNHSIEGFNMVKYFTIITIKEKEIDYYINNVLHRGSTRLVGHGSFTGEEKAVIFTVVKRHQAILLRNFVKEVDPKAFMMITNTSQIVGKGFNIP